MVSIEQIDNDDSKYAPKILNDETDRRLTFYALLITLLLDIKASKAEVLDHLTLWSWILHMLYFELPLSSTKILPWLHGPSLSGAYALFFMYTWTMIANPNMEFDLAPEGRSDIVVYLRAFWLHAAPVVLHYMDMKRHSAALRRAYQSNIGMFLSFWTSVGGYFAMGLTWEASVESSAGTYNVTWVSEETYVNVSKALGIVACLVTFNFIIKPKLIA